MNISMKMKNVGAKRAQSICLSAGQYTVVPYDPDSTAAHVTLVVIKLLSR